MLFSGGSPRNHAGLRLDVDPLVARRSGVFRRDLQLVGSRDHVLLLLSSGAGASHAEVLVVETIPHHIPNDSGFLIFENYFKFDSKNKFRRSTITYFWVLYGYKNDPIYVGIYLRGFDNLP